MIRTTVAVADDDERRALLERLAAAMEALASARLISAVVMRGVMTRAEFFRQMGLPDDSAPGA